MGTKNLKQQVRQYVNNNSNIQNNIIYSNGVNKHPSFIYIIEMGAITMSRFPKPITGRRGRDYEFPRARCSMKECKPEECSTDRSGQTIIPFYKGTITSKVNNLT